MLMQLTKASFQKYMMKDVDIDEFGMQPSIDCLLGNLVADLIQAYIYNSNGDWMSMEHEIQ